jgi:hypothetical protein
MSQLRFGRTPLHMAARTGGELALRQLYDDGAAALDLNRTDDHGFTALYHAALFGHSRTLALLLSWGADVAKPDLGGLTALHIACEKGHAEAATCLLQHGAALDALDSIGRTPLDWARAKEHDSVVAAVEEAQRVAEAAASLLACSLAEPVPLQIPADVVRLVGTACSGVEGLYWHATCKDFRSARPPLRMLLVDDLVYDDFAVPHFSSEPVRVSVVTDCFGIDQPEWLCCADAPASAPIPSISAARMVDAPIDGLRVHVRLYGDEAVHAFLSRLSPVHAAEVTHLSLSLLSDAPPCTGGCELPPSHGDTLTSLRVLEVLHARAQLGLAQRRSADAEAFRFASARAIAAADANQRATASLVRSTSGTLRTLAIVAPNLLSIEEALTLLRDVGPRLSYLSLFVAPCEVHHDPAAATCHLGWEDNTNMVVEEGEGGGLVAEEDDEDIETEMLSNAAEGLCIALLEPARVLCHVPLRRLNLAAPAAAGERPGALHQCAAALPDQRWLC